MMYTHFILDLGIISSFYLYGWAISLIKRFLDPMKCKMILITTFHFLKTSIFKRKHAESETQSHELLNVYDKINLVNNNPYLSRNETLTTFTSAQENTKPSKLGKYEHYENSNRFYANNDANNLTYLSNVKFDQYLNDGLNTNMSNNFQDYIQVKSMENTSFQFKSNVTDHTNKITKVNKNYQNNQFCEENKLPPCSTIINHTSNLQTPSVNKIYKKLKDYILSYTIENIAHSYSSGHIKRLKKIEEVYNIFDKYKPNPKIYFSVFNHPYYKVVLNDLISMYQLFDKSSIFNKETYEKFLNDFNTRIYYNLYSTKLREKMTYLLSDHKNIIFFSEVMELYKYIDDIPEILSLFGLFNEDSFERGTFILHLIIMFADKIKNMKESRVFILCMISKAMDVFYFGSFNVFLIPFYKFKCYKGLHDLNFFTWELNSFKRRDLSVRRSPTNLSFSSDKKYLKVVFLIYVYQNMVFLKYYDVGIEGIKLYENLIDKINQSSECFACLFTEYLSMVKKCINEKL